MSELYPAYQNTVNGKKWGYLNGEGCFVISPAFDDAHEFNENLAIVRVNDLYGMINESGHFTAEPEFQFIGEITGGKAVAVSNQEYTIINKYGTPLTDETYSYIGPFSEGRAVVCRFAGDGPRYGYINEECKEIVPAEYLSAEPFKDRAGLVKKTEKFYQLINANKEVLFEFNYPYVGKYGNGLFVFKKDDKYGYIDSASRIMIQPIFTEAFAFTDGFAKVKVNNQYGVIDLSGRYVFDAAFDEVKILGQNRFALGKANMPGQSENGLLYALGGWGRLLTNFIFSSIDEPDNGLISVVYNDQTFLIDLMGTMVRHLPFIQGTGRLQIKKELIRADIDGITYYCDKTGKPLYFPEQTVGLNEQIKITGLKYKISPYCMIYYPQISGLNPELTSTVNEKLRSYSRLTNMNDQKRSCFGTWEIKYFKKNLLEIEFSGYDKSTGTGLNIPYKAYLCIDLFTGTFYTLADLFLPEKGYERVLERIIKFQAQTSVYNKYLFDDAAFTLNPQQPFYVTRDELHLFYFPYQMTHPEAGFPEFIIDFSILTDILNTKGEFYQSFH